MATSSMLFHKLVEINCKRVSLIKKKNFPKYIENYQLFNISIDQIEIAHPEHFLDVVKLQYIFSNFTTLYFKDTFSCIVKLHCVLVINFHYIYCKITIEIFNCVGSPRLQHCGEPQNRAINDTLSCHVLETLKVKCQITMFYQK